MVNWKKTQEVYIQNGEGARFNIPSELTQQENWLKRVATAEGNFYGNPNDPKLKYPIKIPTQIIRNYVTAENKEYLTTIETWYGVDAIGNIKTLGVHSPQVYEYPIFTTQQFPSQTNVTVLEQRKTVERVEMKYTTPFNEETVTEAYNRSNKSEITLIVKEVGKGKAGIVVQDFDQFLNGDFYDLLNGKVTEKKIRKSKVEETKSD